MRLGRSGFTMIEQTRTLATAGALYLSDSL